MKVIREPDIFLCSCGCGVVRIEGGSFDLEGGSFDLGTMLGDILLAIAGGEE